MTDRDRKGRFIKGNALSKGQNNAMWKTGTCINSAGYRLIKRYGHPRGNRNYVFEHITIMEDFLSEQLGFKIYISKDFDTHHINHNKLDNRIENLQLTTRSVHIRNHRLKLI